MAPKSLDEHLFDMRNQNVVPNLWALSVEPLNMMSKDRFSPGPVGIN